jgi:hypothetical protein
MTLMGVQLVLSVRRVCLVSCEPKRDFDCTLLHRQLWCL